MYESWALTKGKNCEIKSLFFGLVFLVQIVDLEDFQAQLAGFSLPYLFMFKFFYSSFHRMHVLIQFVLLCQMLSDLRTGYSWQGDCCCREDMSRRQSRRKEVARKEEKENAEVEMRKEKNKVRSKLNRI